MGDGLMAATRPRSKPRRAPAGFDAPIEAPSARERRRIDEEQSRPFRETFEEGRREGRRQARQGTKKKSSARRRAPGGRSARAAARQLQAPVRAQVTSGLRLVGITLALVALYNVLVPPGPQAFSGVLGGLSRAMTWLSSAVPIPERS